MSRRMPTPKLLNQDKRFSTTGKVLDVVIDGRSFMEGSSFSLNRSSMSGGGALVVFEDIVVVRCSEDRLAD